jgi:hypothetical protein
MWSRSTCTVSPGRQLQEDGDCCPNADGVYLGCCFGQTLAPTTTPTAAPIPSTSPTRAPTPLQISQPAAALGGGGGGGGAGMIAGVVAGVLVLASCLIVGAILVLRKRRRDAKQKAAAQTSATEVGDAAAMADFLSGATEQDKNSPVPALALGATDKLRDAAGDGRDDLREYSQSERASESARAKGAACPLVKNSAREAPPSARKGSISEMQASLRASASGLNAAMEAKDAEAGAGDGSGDGGGDGGSEGGSPQPSSRLGSLKGTPRQQGAAPPSLEIPIESVAPTSLPAPGTNVTETPRPTIVQTRTGEISARKAATPRKISYEEMLEMARPKVFVFDPQNVAVDTAVMFNLKRAGTTTLTRGKVLSKSNGRFRARIEQQLA